MFWVTWFILAILVGVWAGNKGRSGFGYFLLALLLSPLLGALIVLVSSPNQKKLEAAAISSGDSKKCPACAELIRREATKCRFCGADQPAEPLAPPEEQFLS